MTGPTPSWVASANDPEGDFPLDNLPCGVIAEGGGRCATAIGDRVLDLATLEAAGLLDFGGSLGTGDWRAFMARGPADWARLRAALTALLGAGSPPAAAVAAALRPGDDTPLALPFTVTEYTDFYAGRHHAENVGTMFRGPEAALPPNWLHMPIGYNGRASSVVVSGTPVRRPMGQLRPPEAPGPVFAASARFDFELELGAVVGQPSDRRLTVAEADAAIFGYVLLNDWSARDIQTWEYQPLGPFQSKASATTISPWIVTAAALAPMRVAPPARDVALLPHLADAGPMHLDIALEVTLAPAGGAGQVISRTNTRELYYSAAQQLAHHSACGCPMRVGDLLGSGTISGPVPDSHGSMLEIGWNGTAPVVLGDGTRRSFLEDGDRVGFRGVARAGGLRLGFGPCEGTVLPALP